MSRRFEVGGLRSEVRGSESNVHPSHQLRPDSDIVAIQPSNKHLTVPAPSSWPLGVEGGGVNGQFFLSPAYQSFQPVSKRTMPIYLDTDPSASLRTTGRIVRMQPWRGFDPQHVHTLRSRLLPRDAPVLS